MEDDGYGDNEVFALDPQYVTTYGSHLTMKAPTTEVARFSCGGQVYVRPPTNDFSYTNPISPISTVDNTSQDCLSDGDATPRSDISTLTDDSITQMLSEWEYERQSELTAAGQWDNSMDDGYNSCSPEPESWMSLPSVIASAEAAVSANTIDMSFNIPTPNFNISISS